MFRKALKIIVMFVFPVTALIVSGIAIYLDHIHFKESIELSQYAIETEKQHYEELTKPHTQHEEIYDKLSRLDNEIETYRNIYSPLIYPEEEIDNLLDILNHVERLRNEADEAWRYRDYDKADKLINEAYNELAKIPLPMPAPPVPPVPAFSWWLVGVIVAVFIGIGLVVWFMVARRREH